MNVPHLDMYPKRFEVTEIPGSFMNDENGWDSMNDIVRQLEEMHLAKSKIVLIY